MKYINKQMAVLAATSTFIQVANLTEFDEHYTLSERVDVYELTIFCNEKERLFTIVDHLRNAGYLIDEEQIEYDYLQKCKAYTADINFKY